MYLYRYLFDSQIGFRDLQNSKEPSSLLQNSGYYPLDNKKKGKCVTILRI
jgi:hypothetical protein